MLIDYSKCAQCNKTNKMVCASCGKVTLEQFHSYCMSYVVLTPNSISMKRFPDLITAYVA